MPQRIVVSQDGQVSVIETGPIGPVGPTGVADPEAVEAAINAAVAGAVTEAVADAINTADLVDSDDLRLSNERVPTDVSVTSAKVSPSLKDPAGTTAGLRTLGLGPNQAAPGDALLTEYLRAAGAEAALGTRIDGFRPDLISTIPNPAYFAHRGGALVGPENTLEAMRVAVAGQCDGIELDVQPLADGGLGVMHDATIDRTTTETGTVAEQTSMSWLTLNAADPTGTVPWNGRVVPPPLLDQVISEFGAKQLLMIEPKDAANVTQIADMCDQAALQGSAILQASTTAMVTAIKARGYKCYRYWGNTVSGAELTEAIAAGADSLGCNGAGSSDATITTLVATGKPVFCFDATRRTVRDRLLGLGVHGFLTDQPTYLRSNIAMRKRDSWYQGVYGHGLAQAVNIAWPTITGGALRVDHTATQFVCVGEVSPIANAAGTYTIDVDVMWESAVPASGGISLGVYDTDRGIINESALYGTGWYFNFRTNGQLGLYKATAPSTGTVITGFPNTAAPVTGAWSHMQLVVTATTVKGRRTDGTPTDTPVATDGTQRGGYVHLGKHGAGTVQFRNLVITP